MTHAVKPAAFLDRDGTLIELVHHLTDPAKVRLVEGAAEGIRTLQKAGYSCVVVTNQSVVGRGMILPRGLAAIHEEMERQLAAGGVEIEGIYSCPVAPLHEDPEVIEHADRKPGPGMLLSASRELGLDIGRSWVIGDSLSDMLAGRHAGCFGTVLVRSGYGREVDPSHEAIDHVADDLRTAARWIVRRPPRS